MTDKMPSNFVPANRADDELLTAFLDGELSETEKKETEKRLEAEPNLRARLEKLRAADDFLSRLELLPVSHEMTANTMEILTGVVQKEIRAAEARRRRTNLVFLLILLLIAAGVFFLAGRWFRGRFSLPAAGGKDYPVYSRLDELEAVQSLSFLKQLREIPYFSGEETESENEEGNPAGDRPGPPGIPPEDGLSPFENDRDGPPAPPDIDFNGPFGGDFDSRPGGGFEGPPGLRPAEVSVAPEDLFLKKTKYNNLPKSERERYRALYNAILADPESGRLLETLARFGDWFRYQISESDRYRIGAEPEESRRELVEKILEESRSRPSGRGFRRMGRPSRKPQPGGPHARTLAALKEQLPEELRNESLGILEQYNAFAEKRSDSEPERGPAPPPQSRRTIRLFIEENGLDFFAARLSEKGRAYLASQSGEEKERLIGLLVQIEVFAGREREQKPPLPSRRGGRGPYPQNSESTAELAETLENLPDEMREELLSLPAEEMYSRLLDLHRQGRGPHLPGEPPAPPEGEGEER